MQANNGAGPTEDTKEGVTPGARIGMITASASTVRLDDCREVSDFLMWLDSEAGALDRKLDLSEAEYRLWKDAVVRSVSTEIAGMVDDVRLWRRELPDWRPKVNPTVDSTHEADHVALPGAGVSGTENSAACLRANHNPAVDSPGRPGPAPAGPGPVPTCPEPEIEI